MNRRNRTLLVLLIAVVLASVASYLVFRAISRMPVREVEVATMHVAVAAENLPMGTRLAKEHIKLVGWPSASPVEGSFSSPDAVIGRGLIQSVNANEPLTEKKLAPVEAGAGLAPTIPPGMRAISVRVNDVISVAGYTVPGSRVDVLATLRVANQDGLARVVLSNIQVLTAGTMYDQEQAKNGQAIPTTVVTLMVTPNDAERLTLAQSAGSITLVLRNPLDTQITETTGVRMGSLMGAPAAPPVMKNVGGQRRAVPQPPPTVVKTSYDVETFRAGKKAVEVVANGGEKGDR